MEHGQVFQFFYKVSLWVKIPLFGELCYVRARDEKGSKNNKTMEKGIFRPTGFEMIVRVKPVKSQGDGKTKKIG